jgi:hypothetical protein
LGHHTDGVVDARASAVKQSPVDASLDYRCAPFTCLGSVADMAIVYLPLTGSIERLHRSEVSVLRRCTDFASLAEHAKRFTRDDCLLDDNDTASVGLQRLKHYAARNLFMCRDTFLHACGARRRARRPERQVEAIGIPTRERPSELRRSLTSYVENALEHGRAFEFIIVDDSRELGQRDFNKHLIVDVAGRYDVAVRYAGHDEKAHYAAVLARESGCPPDVVSFGLLGDSRCIHSHGSNRNCLLLDTVGTLFLSFDDDSVCRMYLPEQAEETDWLRLSGREDPTTTWYFANRERALARSRLAPADIGGLHERVLGRTTGDIASEFAEVGRVSIDATCVEVLRGLFDGRGEVVATFNGLIGDCGQEVVPNPVSLLMYGRVSSETAYRQARTSREVLRCATRTTVWRGGGWMNFAAGFDNSALLPPFMPVQRSEDSFFMQLLARCFPNSHLGHVPHAVLHDPMGPRVYRHRPTAQLRMVDIVNSFIAGCRVTAWRSTPEERMEALGEYLEDLGSADHQTFRQELESAVVSNAVGRAASVEAWLGDGGQPAFCVSEMERYMNDLKADIGHRRSLVPADLVELPDPVELAQVLVLKIGRFLKAWPSLVRAAKVLRDRGVRLSRNIEA